MLRLLRSEVCCFSDFHCQAARRNVELCEAILTSEAVSSSMDIEVRRPPLLKTYPKELRLGNRIRKEAAYLRRLAFKKANEFIVTAGDIQAKLCDKHEAQNIETVEKYIGKRLPQNLARCLIDDLPKLDHLAIKGQYQGGSEMKHQLKIHECRP